MKFAMINMPVEYYSPQTGGAVGTVIREVTSQLLQRGHFVHVLTIKDQNPVYEDGSVIEVKGTRGQDAGIPRRLIGKAWRMAYRWDYPRYHIYLNSVLGAMKRLEQLDAVVVHNDYAMPYHLRRSLPRRVKILAHIHNEPHSDFLYLKESMDCVDRFIAISTFIKTRLISVFQIRPERIQVALNGVTRGRFFPRPADEESTMPARILFVGRVNRDKGPDIAANAVLKLREEGLDISLDVAGPVWWHGERADGNAYYDEVRNSVEAGKGKMLGDIPRHQVPALMRSYDITCAMSRWDEPYGLVVSEAMASGCAVLASNRGGIPEVVGVAGVIADPGDPIAVADQLRRLITDRAFLMERRQASLVRARELSWAVVAAAYEQAIASA